MGANNSIHNGMSVIFIDTSQLVKGAERLQNMSKELEESVDLVLDASALEIAERAKQLAPRDRGFLAQHITPNTSAKLRKEVDVLADYAAYVEFGTGAYAAAYAASLPSTWQQFALSFKGRGGGTFAEMLKRIQEWVRLKGIASGNEVKSVAYLIARSILIHGIRPHPFLFPAFMQQQPQLIKDLETALKVIK